MSILDLTDLPRNPVKRVLWLSELENLIHDELHAAYREAYFEARQEDMFDVAVDIGPYSVTAARALTREENERRGRQLKWSRVEAGLGVTKAEPRKRVRRTG